MPIGTEPLTLVSGLNTDKPTSLGEFFDLEALAKVADETGRYTFFFSSWPLNILGGIASPPNAAAIF